jgi:alpha-glucosidase (family GH31 glycosyl hydrolase)
MKTVKILIAGFVLTTLVACDKLAKIAGMAQPEENTEIEAEPAEDQLQQQEVEQMAELINEVALCLDSIQEQEQMVTMMGESTPKAEILSKLRAFRETLERKKAEIARLTEETQSDKKTITSLKKTIAYLNQQLEEKSARIAKLEEAVKKRDVKIAELNNEVDDLTFETGKLRAQNQEQERRLNEGYYIVGKKKELKELGLLSGGLFSKKRANYSNINNSTFTKVDIRNFNTLVIASKSPKLVTEKPASSYTLTKNGDGTSTLTITNAKEFWEASPYLIIME